MRTFLSKFLIMLIIGVIFIIPSKPLEASQSGILSLKFGQNQVFDVQWSISGTTLNTSSFNYPFTSINISGTASAARMTPTIYNQNIANERYYKFIPSPTVSGTYGLAIYNSDDTLFWRIHNTGTFRALSPDVIFYNGAGSWGTLITLTNGYDLGDSDSWENIDTSVTSEDLENFEPGFIGVLNDGESAPATFSLTFNGNGADNSMSNQTITSGVSTNINLNSLIRSGYTFESWNTLQNGSGNSFQDGTPITITSNTTLYAQWNPVQYTVQYVLNSGLNSDVNPSTFTIESGLISFSSGLRAGYIFDGWFENSDLITSGITQLASGSIGNRTLYAKWTALPLYTVTYNLDGGSNNGANPTSYTEDLGTITLQNPTKSGHTFEGWFEDSGLTTSGLSQFLATRAQNLTLYAKWSVDTPPAPSASVSQPTVRADQGTPYTIPLIEVIEITLPTNEMTIEVGEDVVLPEASFIRRFGFVRQEKQLPVQIIGTVDRTIPGTYDVMYQVEYQGKLFQEMVTITVQDTVAPTLNVTTPGRLRVGEELSHEVDVTDNTENVDLVIESTLNASIPGVYPVTYIATDTSGNQTKETIYVMVERPKPVVTSIRFNNYNQYLIQLDPMEFNLENTTIDVVQTNELIGLLTWIPYEEGMKFEDLVTPIYIRIRDDQGREFVRKVFLTVQQ